MSELCHDAGNDGRNDAWFGDEGRNLTSESAWVTHSAGHGGKENWEGAFRGTQDVVTRASCCQKSDAPSLGASGTTKGKPAKTVPRLLVPPAGNSQQPF